MLERLIEKIAEKQDFYKNLKNDIEYLRNLVERKVEKIKQLEKIIETIAKIVKEGDARNKVVKEIKKVLKGENK